MGHISYMHELGGFLGTMYPLIQGQVKSAMAQISLEEIKLRAAARTLPLVDVKMRIMKRAAPVAVIAEIKRASPRRAAAQKRDIFTQVQAYVDGGATAISVLTEPTHFLGSREDLMQLKESFPYMPFLRKDFIISEYQVYESKSAGADMLLLITRWLEDDELKALYQLSHALGLQVLVEVESEEDFERTMKIGAEIIGINARSLFDLTVDTKRVRNLAAKIKNKDFILIGESGVDSVDIVRQWHAAGVDAVLAGNVLMETDDPRGMVREFLLK
ncbi:MAG: indole-3-glycerol phosphate synthase TrpC [bacterium]